MFSWLGRWLVGSLLCEMGWCEDFVGDEVGLVGHMFWCLAAGAGFYWSAALDASAEATVS